MVQEGCSTSAELKGKPMSLRLVLEDRNRMREGGHECGVSSSEAQDSSVTGMEATH